MSFLKYFRRHTEKPKRYKLAYGGNGFISISKDRYANVIVSSMFDLLFTGLSNAVWSLEKGATGQYAKFVHWYKNGFDIFVSRLYSNGYVALKETPETIIFCDDINNADIVITSSDYKVYGETTQNLLEPILRYLDHIVNAADSSIRRMGLLVLLSPTSDEYGNSLTEEELRAEEEKLQKEYGILDDQHVVKLLNHSYAVSTLDIGGDKLALNSRLQQAIKMVCGKLKVPYELIPVAIVGNPNQTGVYQQEAQKRLYQTIREYLNLFQGVARQLGLSVQYDTPDAPQDYETASEELTSKILANIKDAETAGYITHEEAVKMYADKIKQYETAK